MPRATENAAQIAALISSAPLGEVERLCLRYEDDPRKQVISAVASARRRLEAHAAEMERVGELYRFQREVGGDGVILGVDEVGRGSVAGPLTVCAVLLPEDPQIAGLNDSKQLSPAKRERIAEEISRVALAIGIAHIEPESIDALGMAQCLRMAVIQAVQDSGVEPDCVLMDGNPLYAHERERSVVKGDARCASIAAASIFAKVTRDALMMDLDASYPAYHFAQNKGYAAADHIAAIREHGLSPVHRRSFCGNFVERPTLFS